MKKRILYGFAIFMLAVSVLLVVWQGSLRFGFGPSNPEETFFLWAVSTLIFVLMVTLGFILLRTFLKLYIERQSNREGSRIKTKLLIGALSLSLVPVFFLVLFSYQVLNRSLQAWFSAPAANQLRLFVNIASDLKKEMQDEVKAQAALLASRPETRRALAGEGIPPGFLERFAQEQELQLATIAPPSGGPPVASWGNPPLRTDTERTVTATAPVKDGTQTIGLVSVVSLMPVDVARQKAEIEEFNHQWGQILENRKNVRRFYIMLMALITLFVLFVATWTALFLAKQISIPISALLAAASEVRKGNLKHRINVKAMDELASLVRGFNQMTQELEANSRELDRRSRFTEAILESIPTGVLSISSDGRIQRTNRALSKIFPLEQVERATRLEDLFSREDTAEMKYMMKKARRTGVASRQLELKMGNRNLQLAVTV